MKCKPSAAAMVLRHKTHGNKWKEDNTMKKIISNIYILAALLMAGATFTACSSSEDSINEQPAEPTTPKTCTLTVNATKIGDATTRALALDESGASNVLNATWTEGDKVIVYYMHPQDMGVGEIRYTPTEIGSLEAQSSGASTTLTGDITTKGITIGGLFGESSETHDLTTGDKLYLSYTGTLGEGLMVFNQQQDGTLKKLADYFDSAGADVTVSSVSASTVTISEASAQFENLSFIIRFKLLDNATSSAISPSKLAIKCETTGEYPVVGTTNIDIPDATYTANGAGVVFVQLPRTNQTTGFTGDITLTATVGDDTYTYTKSGVTFTNGNYYEITVKMSKLYTCNSSDWSAKVAAFNAETSANPTLQLTSDININRHSFILTRSNGILDLNGHTLSALDVRNNVEGQSITIKNGTVSGDGDVAIDGHPDWADFYQGTVILEDLTVNKMIFVDGHQYIINSGTYNEKIFNVTTSGYPGKLVINGGKFLLSIHGEYSGVTYGTYELRGGKYAIRPEDSWCASGYSVKENTDDDSATYPWIVSEGIQSVPELGDLYYSDGTYSSTLVSGKTPIGVIAYIDQSGTADDEITEKSNGGGHGLVLCLKNAASNLVWHTTREWVFSESVSVQNTAALKRYSDVSGYSLTSTLSASANASTAFPAAWQAKNYSELTAPSGSTGWFLPSAQQWVRMMTGLGGLSEDAIVYGSVFDNSHSAIDLWDAAFAKAGSGNYDSMSQSSMYWTSSECDQTNAIRVVVDQSNATGYGPSLYINGFVKDGNGSGYCRVRPVLAF